MPRQEHANQAERPGKWFENTSLKLDGVGHAQAAAMRTVSEREVLLSVGGVAPIFPD